MTNFGVGTVAGGVAAFACHPLDVIRTRFVGQGEPKVTWGHSMVASLDFVCVLFAHRSIPVFRELLS